MCSANDCSDDGAIDRRTFLTGAAAAAGGVLITGSADAQETSNKTAPTRVLDDPRIQHGPVVFKHNGADSIDGYLARPKAEGVYPAVLVVAGNKITEEYIPNTCAALAVAGFVGVVANNFHPLPPTIRFGDYPEYEKHLKNHTEIDRLDDIQAAASYLRTLTFVKSGGMGIVGFCGGGREAMLFAARSRDIDVVVPFHPAPMEAAELTRLRGLPIQIHHGTADRSVKVEESKKTFDSLKLLKANPEIFTYEGADHGFLAYTRPFYKPIEAQLAWDRAVRFLQKHLK